MRRRAYLGTVVAGAGLLVAGCSNRGRSDGYANPQAGGNGGHDVTEAATVATPPRARPAIQATFGFEPATDGSYDTIEIGSRESVVDPEDNHPWEIVVWNDADVEREFDIAVYAARGRPVERTISLPARNYYRIRLLKPDRYTVQVRLVDQPRYKHEIATSEFDCNDHSLRLRVSPTGLVQYHTASTLVACSTPATPADAATPE